MTSGLCSHSRRRNQYTFFNNMLSIWNSFGCRWRLLLYLCCISEVGISSWHINKPLLPGLRGRSMTGGWGCQVDERTRARDAQICPLVSCSSRKGVFYNLHRCVVFIGVLTGSAPFIILTSYQVKEVISCYGCQHVILQPGWGVIKSRFGGSLLGSSGGH